MKTKDKGIVLFLVLTAITAFSSCMDPVSSIDPLKLPVKMTITSQPSKLVYELYENPDWTGLKVSSTCLDGSTREETINDSDIRGFYSSYPGIRTITVTKNGVSATFTVTIVNPSLGPVLVSLSISVYPYKQVYELYESPDWTGLTVTGTYSDGSTRTETIDYYSGISGFDSRSTGVKTITVTKNGVSATFTVTIVDPSLGPVLVSLSISALPDKLGYWLYESSDWTGLEITGTYSDGSTMTETIDYYSDISGFDSWSTGEKTITVTKNGLSATFTVTIVDPSGLVLVSLSISSLPDKLVYESYESPDWAGMVVTETYSDGSTRVVGAVDCAISGFDSSSVGEKTITVTKNSVSATFTVTVIPALVSLSISVYPDKRVYEFNESPDWTGLTVIGNYSDSNAKIETIGESDITGFDSTSPGVQTITISKGSQTVTFTVEVLDKGNGSIGILPPPSAADIILSWTGTAVTAPAGYTGYQWFVDDMARTADAGSDGRTITLNTPAYSAGKHRVRVTAWKQGLPYSGETAITVL